MSRKYHATYTMENIDNVLGIVADNPRKAALKYCSAKQNTVINTQNCIIYVWENHQWDNVSRYRVNTYFHRTGMNWGLHEIK